MSLRRKGRARILFSYFIIAILSLQIGASLLPDSHAESDRPVPITHSWRDAVSGGVWARMNEFKTNLTMLDSAQASSMFGSPTPSVSSSQEPTSPFSNNFRVTGNSSFFPLEDEPSIAVTNQTGRFLMVLGANSLSTGKMVAYFSQDQGTHWTGPTLLPLARANDSFASDPALGVNRTGTFFYGFISVSSAFFFSGGLDDVVVATSIDGGNWTNHVAVQRRPASGNFTGSELFDKPYLAVGPSRTDPSKDAVYVTYTDFVQFCGGPFFACRENVTIMQVHSNDFGVTWSQPIPVSPTVTFPAFSTTPHIVQGSMPAVAPNGDLYTAYYDSGEDGFLNGTASVMVSKSTDGGNSFSPPTQVALIPQELTFRSGGTFGFRWWASMFPSMEVAPSGTVYVAYGAKNSNLSIDPADVYLIASSDGGATWSQPKRINDDSTQNGQFFAWLKVSADGVVHIIWGDMRLDPVGIGYDIFYAKATNQGTVISTNTRVTDVGTDPLLTIGFVGDYFNLAVSGSQVYPVWTDGRRGVMSLGRRFAVGNTDIFTARLGPRDTPSITISTTTPAGYLAPAPISGSGLPREAFFVMRINGVGTLSQKNAIVFFFSDKSGNLSDIIIPSFNYYGSYTVELDEWLSGAQLASTTLYVVDTRNLQVLVTGPSIAFPSDNVTWNLQLVSPSGTLNQPGFSSTLTITQALLTSPNGQVLDLTAQVKSTGTGSFSLSTTLSTTAAPGSYTLFVNATQTGLIVQRMGSGTATLTISSPLSGLPNQVSSAQSDLRTLQIYTAIVGAIAALGVVLQVLTLTRRRPSVTSTVSSP